MSSISSLSSSSSSSSIYGNRTYNIISGLASGMDTEELISGLVQSYQQKIQSLQQKNTKYQWQQEAYQSISNKLVEFDRNYSSYVYSNTNLSSASFFNNAVITTAKGTHADAISASGKSSSDITINAVNSLASAARYSGIGKISTGAVGGELGDLDGEMTLSGLSGSLTLKYGGSGSSISLDFGKDEMFVDDDGNFDAAGFQKAIEEKLGEQQISTSSGSKTASKLISVEVSSDGAITFSDKSGGGNSISVSASGDLKEAIKDYGDLEDQSSSKVSFSIDPAKAEKKTNVAEALEGKTMTVTLNGLSKSITLPSIDGMTDADGSSVEEKFAAALNDELAKAFGKDQVTVSLVDNKLSFELNSSIADGSTLSVTAADTAVSKALGLEGGVANYVDTSKTLKELGIELGDGFLEINGVKINKTAYTEDTELNTILNDINSNTQAGVKVSYSKITNQFVFNAKDTGSGGRIDIAEGGLGANLFGATVDANGDRIQSLVDNKSYSSGQDAKIIATINGQAMELTRSSNSFDLDGMNITVNGTFNKGAVEENNSVMIDVDGTKKEVTDSVTFTSKTDADTIVDAVKKMVDDLNAIIKEVKSAYSDMPLQQSDGSKYEPLTDADMEDMSESAIEKYEEKAKTGILFMDSDLSSLYNDLRSAITSSGADGVTLRSIGISTSYSDGLTTLTFDEQTFREALESDPDKVQQAFTKSKENGAATDGLMASIKKITDKYAATTGATKGILIEKAGSKYSPTAALDNTMLDKMNDIEEQISKWQDKMSDQVDYYTNKFTQLELLINQMNSQSSALAGFMGG